LNKIFRDKCILKQISGGGKYLVSQKTASALKINTKEDTSRVKNLTKALKRF
jgi:hypothetical protein